MTYADIVFSVTSENLLIFFTFLGGLLIGLFIGLTNN